MGLRFLLASGAAVAVAILPSSTFGQKGPGAAKPVAVADRVVVAEVRESNCRDGRRSVRVQLLAAGDPPAEIRMVDAQGFVHVYVLSAHPKQPVSADRGCTERLSERGPVFPWY